MPRGRKSRYGEPMVVVAGGLRVPQELAEKLRAEAEERGLSVTEILRDRVSVSYSKGGIPGMAEAYKVQKRILLELAKRSPRALNGVLQRLKLSLEDLEKVVK